MKINVKVVAGCSFEKIEKISKHEYKIWLCDQAKNNRANQSLIKVLSGYFQVSRSQVYIIGGKKSREKIVEILK